VGSSGDQIFGPRPALNRHPTMGSFAALSDKKNFAELEWICGKLIANGARPFLVGGCVRDALLGIELADFDLEIFSMPLDEIEKLLTRKFTLEKTGKKFCVLKISGLPVDISVPRSERKIGNGHGDFCVKEISLPSVKEAASRRDFTINAIYFDVANGVIIDEFGGVDDLECGIMRSVGEQFSEDPLRVLRGMQFAGRFCLGADRETLDLCKKLSIDGLSRERIFGEWEKLILKSVRPSLALSFLKDSGWLKFFPEIDLLDGCMQDPKLHPEGSVFEHVRLTLDAFAETRIGDRREDLILGFAALCHDFGKPYVTTRDLKGIHHYGHDEAGLEPTAKFLHSINAPNYLIDGVLPLVRYHMLPRFLLKNDPSDSAVLRLANSVGRIDRLLRLNYVDFVGRTGFAGTDDGKISNWLTGAAQRLGVFSSKPEPMVMGRDLVALGMLPAQNFSDILERCFTAQLNGEFTDRRSAMAYLAKMAKLG
jgi:tRNA nucleotidyltransferase (CCA-adding enzyme)